MRTSGIVPRGAVCTIIAKNYLPHARCLLDSIAQFHPDLARFVILADRADGYFDVDGESFTVVSSSDLAIPDSQWFHFKHSLIELCTALKPYAFEHLFAEYDFDFVIYLDPDVLVYAGLDPLLDRLRHYSMVVTPHLTMPLDPRQGLSELQILRAGIYNLGFLALARTEESLSFLQWWKDRLHEHCVIDLPRGLFLDQRWVDFAPCFISRLCVLRDSGYNVAYWNVSHREISAARGTFYVNTSQLYFFHFSGFNPDAPGYLSQHEGGYRLPESGALRSLVEQYRRLLIDYGYNECRDWPYTYNYFANGVRIPDLGRSIDKEDAGIVDRIADPFSEEAFQEFVRVWNEPVRTTNERPSITRLAYKIYRTRPELQAAMPDVFNGDYLRFLNWLLSSGAQEQSLPDVFLGPFKNGTRVAIPARAEKIASHDDFWSTIVDSSSDQTRNHLAQLISAGQAGLSLPRLALKIHEKRPDLQAFFPDPLGRDGVRYLVWLLSYGRREYSISRVFLDRLYRQWNSVLDSLPNGWDRVRYRTFLALANIGSRLGALLGGSMRERLLLRVLRPGRDLVLKRQPVTDQVALSNTERR